MRPPVFLSQLWAAQQRSHGRPAVAPAGARTVVVLAGEKSRGQRLETRVSVAHRLFVRLSSGHRAEVGQRVMVRGWARCQCRLGVAQCIVAWCFGARWSARRLGDAGDGVDEDMGS